MDRKTVVVLFGGKSNEYEVSLISAVNIISNIDKIKYHVLPVGITKSGQWLMYNGDPDNIKNNNQWEKEAVPVILSPNVSQKGLLKLEGNTFELIHIDVVFPIMHGKYGEDGSIQGYLEMMGIPYVGCGVLASSISMDKVFTKIIVNSLGIAQAEYIVVTKEQLNDIAPIIRNIETKLGYPCFVKPANSGSSVGISKATDFESLKKGIIKAFDYDKKIVVEQAIYGRELECAVLGNQKPIASCIGEIIAAADFYDYDAKYNNSQSKTIVPANLDDGISEKIQNATTDIFSAVNGAGLSRVDFFLENNTNRIVFNEINTMPGFTSISMYAMLWANSGIPTAELIEKLLMLAFENNVY